MIPKPDVVRIPCPTTARITDWKIRAAPAFEDRTLSLRVDGVTLATLGIPAGASGEFTHPDVDIGVTARTVIDITCTETILDVDCLVDFTTPEEPNP